MKKLLKTIMFSAILISILFSTPSKKAYAFETIPNDYQITLTNTSGEISISPFAEEIGYIYKILNGKQYKRLWSYTYARWIDPDWTLA